MKLVDMLLQSAQVSGRVSALIVFGALAIFLVVHLARGLSMRRTVAHSDPASIVGAALTAALGLFVAGCVWWRWGSVPVPVPIVAVLIGLCSIAGSVMCFMALSFIVWGFLALDASGHVLAKVDHGAKLVTAGPFTVVRHPVYFGIGLLLLGAGLAATSWWALVAAAAWWPVAVYRARLEDTLLRRAFGAEFEEYARRVPSLAPGFGSRPRSAQ